MLIIIISLNMLIHLSIGVDFRSSIVEVVKTCTIFLPLINDAWAQVIVDVIVHDDY